MLNQLNAPTTIGLLPGDAIERPGPAGTMHRAIFAGWNQLGQPCVIHNPKDGHVRYDLFQDFAAGLLVSFVTRAAKNAEEQNLIVARAHSLLGRKYHLLNFNCDHLVTYALNGVARSPQLGVAFLATLAVAALAGVAVASRRA